MTIDQRRLACAQSLSDSKTPNTNIYLITYRVKKYSREISNRRCTADQRSLRTGKDLGIGAEVVGLSGDEPSAFNEVGFRVAAPHHFLCADDGSCCLAELRT